MFKVLQDHTPVGVASKYFGGVIFRFYTLLKDSMSDSELRHKILNTNHTGEFYTNEVTLNEIASQAKQYNMYLIVNNTIQRYCGGNVSYNLYGRVSGIIADLLTDLGFNGNTAAIALMNEPGKYYNELEYVQYCYRSNDTVRGRFPLILVNDEYHHLDEKIIFGQTINIPNRIFGVHHLSSLDKNFKNVVYAKTQANGWGVPIICTEGGSWFKSYRKDEGHNINIRLIQECKNYGYDSCAIVCVDVNEWADKNWKALGYRVWDNNYKNILLQENWDKFIEELKKYKTVKPIINEVEDMKLERFYYKNRPASLIKDDPEGYGIMFLRACFGLFHSNVFDEALDIKVRQYQIDNNLLVDGKVGPETFGNMIKVEDFYKHYCWVHSLWARGL